MADAQQLQIARIALNVADLAGACRFYVEALGFLRLADRGEAAVLRLGRQEIELRSCAGRAYPQPRSANDPWFQHFAIVVADMDAAYGRLSGHGQEPISIDGPQRLPPSTGSVTAYKFRDPDGHPLELSYIPGSAWLGAPAGDSPFLDIDHSALAVRDLDASLAFYVDVLGFSMGARGLNQGLEQDRLDGLDGVQLDIVSVQTVRAGPHIELLHYRAPLFRSDPVEPDLQDIAATRLILRTASLPDLKRRLDRAAAPWSDLGDRIGLRDPDGHALEALA